MEHKIFEAEVKEFNETDLTVTHFISTEKKDRGGDIMRADGMKIKGRPVVLLAHGFSQVGQEPVAKPVWIKKGEFKGSKGIMAKTQFFPDELGQRLWAKTTSGFMPNWSIGFIPIQWDDGRDRSGTYYRDMKEWELLEYSPVGVPMNPDAQSIKFKIMDSPNYSDELARFFPPQIVQEIRKENIPIIFKTFGDENYQGHYDSRANVIILNRLLNRKKIAEKKTQSWGFKVSPEEVYLAIYFHEKHHWLHRNGIKLLGSNSGAVHEHYEDWAREDSTKLFSQWKGDFWCQADFKDWMRKLEAKNGKSEKSN